MNNQNEKKALPENYEKVINKINNIFSTAIIEKKFDRGELTLTVKPEFLIPVAEFLKEEPELKFNFLSDICAVHFPKEKEFEVVYNLYSIIFHHRIRLKVRIKEGESITSLTRVWSAANWLEREVYDMSGITFDGHPNLKRILLSGDWKGHPLRKDYPLSGKEE